MSLTSKAHQKLWHSVGVGGLTYKCPFPDFLSFIQGFFSLKTITSDDIAREGITLRLEHHHLEARILRPYFGDINFKSMFEHNIQYNLPEIGALCRTIDSALDITQILPTLEAYMRRHGIADMGRAIVSTYDASKMPKLPPPSFRPPPKEPPPPTFLTEAVPLKTAAEMEEEHNRRMWAEDNKKLTSKISLMQQLQADIKEYGSQLPVKYPYDEILGCMEILQTTARNIIEQGEPGAPTQTFDFSTPEWQAKFQSLHRENLEVIDAHLQGLAVSAENAFLHSARAVLNERLIYALMEIESFSKTLVSMIEKREARLANLEDFKRRAPSL